MPAEYSAISNVEKKMLSRTNVCSDPHTHTHTPSPSCRLINVKRCQPVHIRLILADLVKLWSAMRCSTNKYSHVIIMYTTENSSVVLFCIRLCMNGEAPLRLHVSSHTHTHTHVYKNASWHVNPNVWYFGKCATFFCIRCLLRFHILQFTNCHNIV